MFTFIKNKRQSILLRIFIGYLLVSLLVIGLLINKSFLIYDLEQKTYEKMIRCVKENGENFMPYGEEIQKILDEYEREKTEIERKTFTSGITGFVIALAIVLTNITKIIQNLKTITKELLNGNEYREKKQKKETAEGMNFTQKKENVYFTAEEKIYDFRQLEEMIKQVCKKEKEKNPDNDNLKMIENTILLLMDQFMNILRQASSLTEQINHDKEQLMWGIREIRKGFEQIAQEITEKPIRHDNMDKEDIIAALEQINAAIEETGALILQMEKKVKTLSKSVKKYKKDE